MFLVIIFDQCLQFSSIQWPVHSLNFHDKFHDTSLLFNTLFPCQVSTFLETIYTGFSCHH